MFGRIRQIHILAIVVTFGVVLLMMAVTYLRHVPVIRREENVKVYRPLETNDHQFSKPFCPVLEMADIQTNLSQLLVILKDPNYRQTCAWIRIRVSRMWPQWVKSINSLSGKQDLSKRRRRKVLLYLGFLTKKANWGFAETQFKGGALGELVVWSDLIATLYLLGHNVYVATEFEELSRYLDIINGSEAGFHNQSDSCGEPDSLIYTDIVGYRHVTKFIPIPVQRYRCRVRIFDCFGTEPAYNHKTFSEKRGKVSNWGGLNLRPQQFYNMFPHTPDDTFLGFVIGSDNEDRQPFVKENIALVYGKTTDLWEGKSSFLQQFHDHGYEVHGTVHIDGRTNNIHNIPDFVINHGYMKNGTIRTLLQRAKIFIGLGRPYEGPAPLEAISHGAVFINPKFDPPFDYRKNDKPTERSLTSQHPYVEEFIGEPYAYTTDISKPDQVLETIQKINNFRQFPQLLPYEFTNEGLIQRVNAFVEHQDFCQYDKQLWPTDSAIKTILAEEGKSCKDACRTIDGNYTTVSPDATCLHVDPASTKTEICSGKCCLKILEDLICEPSYFQHINTTDSFRRTSSSTCNSTRSETNIYYPAIGVADSVCTLQADDLLFSCVGGREKYRRLCPCRTFIKFQSGLCKGCDT